MCDMSYSQVSRRLHIGVSDKPALIHDSTKIYMCDMAHSYVRRDCFIYATRLIHMWHDPFTCDMTRLYVRHDWFIYATWLIHVCFLAVFTLESLTTLFSTTMFSTTIFSFTFPLVKSDMTDALWAKETPPLVGFSIYYVPWSRAVCTRFHDEMRPSHLVTGALVTWIIHMGCLRPVGSIKL